MYLLICGFQSFPSIFISTLIISTFHSGLWIVSNTSLMFFKVNDFLFFWRQDLMQPWTYNVALGELELLSSFIYLLDVRTIILNYPSLYWKSSSHLTGYLKSVYNYTSLQILHKSSVYFPVSTFKIVTAIAKRW